jgi:hypothetical protein
MLASHVYEWAFISGTASVAVAAMFRCVVLLIGLRLALKGAPAADRTRIYREFARALRVKEPSRRGRTVGR